MRRSIATNLAYHRLCQIREHQALLPRIRLYNNNIRKERRLTLLLSQARRLLLLRCRQRSTLLILNNNNHKRGQRFLTMEGHHHHHLRLFIPAVSDQAHLHPNTLTNNTDSPVIHIQGILLVSNNINM